MPLLHVRSSGPRVPPLVIEDHDAGVLELGNAPAHLLRRYLGAFPRSGSVWVATNPRTIRAWKVPLVSPRLDGAEGLPRRRDGPHGRVVALVARHLDLTGSNRLTRGSTRGVVV